MQVVLLDVYRSLFLRSESLAQPLTRQHGLLLDVGNAGQQLQVREPVHGVHEHLDLLARDSGVHQALPRESGSWEDVVLVEDLAEVEAWVEHGQNRKGP